MSISAEKLYGTSYDEMRKPDVFMIPDGGTLTFNPRALGMPLRLTFSKGGSLFDLKEGKQDEGFFDGNHFRVFVIPERLYQEMKTQRLTTEEAYRVIKELDELWQHVMVKGKPVDGRAEEPYRVIFAWVPHPHSKDRSDVSDMIHLKVNPQSGEIERYIYKPYREVKPGKGITTTSAFIINLKSQFQQKSVTEQSEISLAALDPETHSARLTDKPLTLGPDALGIPVYLTISENGNKLQMTRKPGENITEGDHFRVFTITEEELLNILKITHNTQVIYQMAKLRDAFWKHVMGGRPIEGIGDEPYWVIFKYVPNPQSPDRSNVSDLVRLRIDPQKKEVRRVITDQYVRLKPGEGIDLNLLTADAPLLITDSEVHIPGTNVLTLNNFKRPKGAQCSFSIVHNGEHGLRIILRRPLQVLEEKHGEEYDITPEPGRTDRNHGIDGVEVNGQVHAYPTPRDTELSIPLSEGRIVFLNRANTVIRRSLAVLEFHNGVLNYIEGPEEGSWTGGRIIYRYEVDHKIQQPQATGEAGKQSTLIDPVSDEELLSPMPGDLTFQQIREWNNLKMQQILVRFPGASRGGLMISETDNVITYDPGVNRLVQSWKHQE